MIPEPTSILWPWLRKAIDTTFPIWVDEDAAFRLGAQWKAAAKALEEAVRDASTSNNQLPEYWKDAQGVGFHQQVDRMLNSPGSRTTELITAMRNLSALADEYGRSIIQIKDQIYAELAANGIAFALSFGIPEPFGSWFRQRQLAGMAGRITSFVAGVAARMATFVRGMPKFARAVAGEMLEEPAITLGGNLIDLARGARPEGIDWRQVALAAPTGALGVGLNPIVGPGARVISRRVEAVVPQRMAPAIGRSTQSFISNGITSPVSGTFVQAVADGKNPWTQDYWKALKEQGLGAGVLASSRVHSHDLGHSLREAISPRDTNTPTTEPRPIPTDDTPPPNPPRDPEPATNASPQPTNQQTQSPGTSPSSTPTPSPSSTPTATPSVHAAPQATELHSTQAAHTQAPSTQGHAPTAQAAPTATQSAHTQSRTHAPTTQAASTQHQTHTPAQSAPTTQSAPTPSQTQAPTQSGPTPSQAQTSASTAQAPATGAQPSTTSTTTPHPATPAAPTQSQPQVPTTQPTAQTPAHPTAQTPAQPTTQSTVQPAAHTAAQSPTTAAQPATQASTQPAAQAATQSTAQTTPPAAAQTTSPATAQAVTSTTTGSATQPAVQADPTDGQSGVPATAHAVTPTTTRSATRPAVRVNPTADPNRVPAGKALPGDQGRSTKGDPPAREVADDTDPPHHHDGVVVTAPEGPGFRADGPDEVSPEEALAAAGRAKAEDFGGLLEHGPVVIGQRVVVDVVGLGRQEFTLEVDAVPGKYVAQTTLGAQNVHRTRIDPGVRKDQLTRAWVHEISHAAKELLQQRAPQQTGPEDACLTAQQNEQQLVARQVSEAKAAAERSGRAVDRALLEQRQQELALLEASLQERIAAHQNLAGAQRIGAVEVDVPAGRKILPTTAQSHFLQLLNERDGQGRLTLLAKLLREYYYRTSEVAATTGIVPAHEAQKPGRGTFAARTPDGRVIRFPIPRVKLDAGNDFVPRDEVIIEGTLLSRVFAPFNSPRFGFTAAALNFLQSMADAWGNSATTSDQDPVDIWMSGAEKQAWDAMTEQERAAVLARRPRLTRPDGTQERPIVKSTGGKRSSVWGERLGEAFAESILLWLRSDPAHPQHDVYRVFFPPANDGAGRMDQLYIRVDRASREIRGFVVVEAKGVVGRLISRRGLDGLRYLQGHPEYLHSLLTEIRNDIHGRGAETVAVLDSLTLERVELPTAPGYDGPPRYSSRPVRPELATPIHTAGELLEAMRIQADQGNLQYLVVKAKVKFAGPKVIADGINIEEYDMSQLRITGTQQRTAIQQALNPHRNKGPHYGPEVRGSRYVASGRPASEGTLTADMALDAAPTVTAQDFGGLLDAAPRRDGELVVVKPAGTQEQFFRVEIDRVRRGRVAATFLHAGTRQDPHVVRIAPGAANSQLGRVWVHEISHALHALHGHGSRVGRVLARVTGAVENACIEAQFNEHRLLSRQFAEASVAGDQASIAELRQDIEGLSRAIERFGHTPPAAPWSDASTGTVDLAAAHQQAIARVAELKALGQAKRQATRDAVKAANEAAAQARSAARDRDAGRHGRVREKEREAAAKREVADWNRRRAVAYHRAARAAAKLRVKYAEVLRLPVDQQAAQLQDLERLQAVVDRELAAVHPPRSALPSMMSVGELPRLTQLTEQLNQELLRLGVDHRFTVEDLQLRLNADFGQLVTPDGVVLRVGAGNPVELRFALDIADLREVLNPAAQPSELIHAATSQAGRRIGSTGTARYALNASQSLRDLTRLVFDQLPAIGSLGEFVTLRIDGGFNRSQALTGTAATFSQDGATEDNRGEAVLFEGQGRWVVQVRASEFGRWRPIIQDLTGAAIHGWVSHAYTVPAPVKQVSSGRPATGPLPALIVGSIDGLQRLTDVVSTVFGGRLNSFGEQARDVREQIQEALTQDLPGRLSESTERPIIRPLTAAGKPVGHLEIRTTVRYARTELVGDQSSAHWQERDRVGFRTATWHQTFGTGVSGKGAVELGVPEVAGTGSAYAGEASAGRDAGRSESQSGGGSSLHIGVHRFIGPTQGYRLILTHEVSLVLDGRRHGTVRSESEALVRMRVDDAYRHGLPVAAAALVRDGTGKPRLDPHGRPYLRGDVLPGFVPGRRMELPEWAKPGTGSGPALVQRVTGGEGAVAAVVGQLSERGFLPPMTPEGRIDLDRLTTDPLERQAQLANLEELTAQLSPNRLEVGYDAAVRDGLLVELTRSRTDAPTESVTLRIRLVQDPTKVTVLGTTSDEAMVALNIGSESAGRAVGRSKAAPLSVKPLGLNDSAKVDGSGGAVALSVGRSAFGRGLSSLTGSTVNQVTLLESSSPLAVFELGHHFVVTELRPDDERVVHDVAGSARVLVDSDLLPTETPYEEVVTAELKPAVLQRMLVLAVQNPDLLEQLPAELRQDPLVLNFLDPRNLAAHPEWFGTTYRSGVIAGDYRLGLRGQVRKVQLVSVTDGVGADINLALSNQGASVAWSAATSGTLSSSVAVDRNPNDEAAAQGGGLSSGGSRSYSAGRTQQLITGVERSAIDVGRQYVFAADTKVWLNVETSVQHAVHESGAGRLHFQIGETEALRFFIDGELNLPLEQVADAVERYLNGSLPLDIRTASALIRAYRKGLAATSTPPSLAAHHDDARIFAKLTEENPVTGPVGQRLDSILNQLLQRALPRLLVPAPYRFGLGASVVETVSFQNAPVSDSSSPVLDAVRVVAERIGVAVDTDAVLAPGLFADLAGKRWWGRLDDMLGGRGFVRTYAIEHGQHKGSHLTVRVRAQLSADATHLGTNPGLLSSVQRFLFDDRSTTTTHGRSLTGGLEGAVESGLNGSSATDRAQAGTRTSTEQHSRMERTSEFFGLQRVGRRIKLTVEVSHDPSPAPTSGRLRSRLQPTEARPGLTRSDKIELHGNLVQHLPKGFVPVVAGAAQPGRMPETVFVETVGPQDSEHLTDRVIAGLAEVSSFGRAGVELHRTAIEAQLAPSVLNAVFTRMAGAEGFRILRLSVPGQAAQVVDVVIQATPVVVEEVSVISPNGELGAVSRVARTVGTTISVGRLLSPPAGAAAAAGDTGFRGGFTAGDQRSDQVTDIRGIRRERHRLELGDLVTVRAGIRYVITLVPRRVLGYDPARPDRPGEPIELEPVDGEVYLTGHHHEIGVTP